MAAFEVFRRQAPPGAHEPVVTVQRQGLLTLNRAAHEALGAPEAVELLYARRERLLGLRASPTSTPDAYRVRKQSSGPGFLVSGRAFTQHYGIPTDTARRYFATTIDGLLTVDLSDVMEQRRRGIEKTRSIAKRPSQTAEEPQEGVEEPQR